MSEAPVIDGVLDESLWADIPALMQFVQAEPLEGLPASQETDVRIAYDDTAIFIGVRLTDSDPLRIVTTDTSRDAGLGDQDSFQIVFDTFQDRQNGFVFGTNVAGAQFDAQIRNQGSPSASWDASWDVRTRTDESGWTAEFRIPLRTLRYAPPPQTWGINLMRNIQRNRGARTGHLCHDSSTCRGFHQRGIYGASSFRRHATSNSSRIWWARRTATSGLGT